MAFVMALAIVAVVVGVVLLVPNGVGNEVVDTPTSTPPPTTIPAAPIDLGWEQVPQPDWGGDDWIVVGDRLFGLGWTDCPDVETPGGGQLCPCGHLDVVGRPMVGRSMVGRLGGVVTSDGRRGLHPAIR